MDIVSLFYLVVAVMGIYMCSEAIRMKRTGEISKTVVNEKEIRNCKDTNGFIRYIYWREIVFGVILVIYGVLHYMNTYVYSIGGFVDIIVLVMFVLVVIWFMWQLNKGRKEFFRLG